MFNLFLGVDNSSLVTASWGPASLTLPPPPSLAMSYVGSLPTLRHQAASALTFSKMPAVAGQLDGSWHTHMGELLSSTSHTLPCLQWWFWQGSGRGQGAKSEPAPSPALAGEERLTLCDNLLYILCGFLELSHLHLDGVSTHRLLQKRSVCLVRVQKELSPIPGDRAAPTLPLLPRALDMLFPGQWVVHRMGGKEEQSHLPLWWGLR